MRPEPFHFLGLINWVRMPNPKSASDFIIEIAVFVVIIYFWEDLDFQWPTSSMKVSHKMHKMPQGGVKFLCRVAKEIFIFMLSNRYCL